MTEQERQQEKQQQRQQRLLYGSNDITIEVQSILQTLFTEVLGPFYVFQVFSIILWSCEEYEQYASSIAVISLLSLTTSVYQIRRNQKRLKKKVEQQSQAIILHDSKVALEEVNAIYLVPGNTIKIQDNYTMPCDAVLILGDVVVNESMLTGESVPVTKTPLPVTSDMFDYKIHNKHILFCGTTIMQTKSNSVVKAVVIRTGFNTAKGQLVKSILFPKPVDFKFNRKWVK